MPRPQAYLPFNAGCPIYGDLECVRYKGMEFNIGESQNSDTPHPMSIHYLVLPNYLLVPDFVLLEDISPSSLEELLQIVKGISEMALDGEAIGVGQKRIAHRDRWGVVGERESGWTYQQVFEEGNVEGVYFSPQQMIAFSQNRPNPKYNTAKTDVFALGLMLVEIIFGESLADIYDYQNFEIRLNPLLEKLQRIKEEFGEEVASMLIGMLEIEEEDRLDFQELLAQVSDILAPQQRAPALHMLSSNSSHRNLEHSRGNRTPGRNPAPYSKTPKNNDKGKYRNDVSPFRGRFGGAVKNNPNDRLRRTPDRANESRSPMRRNLQINTRADRETFGGRCVPTPKELDFQGTHVSPLGRR